MVGGKLCIQRVNHKELLVAIAIVEVDGVRALHPQCSTNLADFQPHPNPVYAKKILPELIYRCLLSYAVAGRFRNGKRRAC